MVLIWKPRSRSLVGADSPECSKRAQSAVLSQSAPAPIEVYQRKPSLRHPVHPPCPRVLGMSRVRVRVHMHECGSANRPATRGGGLWPNAFGSCFQLVERHLEKSCTLTKNRRVFDVVVGHIRQNFNPRLGILLLTASEANIYVVLCTVHCTSCVATWC